MPHLIQLKTHKLTFHLFFLYFKHLKQRFERKRWGFQKKLLHFPHWILWFRFTCDRYAERVLKRIRQIVQNSLLLIR